MPKSQPSAQKSASTKSETTIWTGVAWGVFLGSTAVFVIGWFAIRLSPTTVNAGNNSIGVATLLTSLIVLSAFIYLLLPIVRSHQDRSPPHPDRTNSSPEDRKYDLVQIGLTVFGAFGAIFLVATGYMALNVDSKQTGLGTGAFGDAFGAATSLFTALAFLGLLVTSQIQRKELKTAQDSFKQLQKQTEQVLTTQRTQILEDRFFKLIEQIDRRRQAINNHDGVANLLANDLTGISDGLIDRGSRGTQLKIDLKTFSDNLRNEYLKDHNIDITVDLGVSEIIAADCTLQEGNLVGLKPLLISQLTPALTAVWLFHSLSDQAGLQFNEDKQKWQKYRHDTTLIKNLKTVHALALNRFLTATLED